MTNISSGLVGLSILTGTNSFQTLGLSLPGMETAAVRAAKAQFTIAPTIAPWQKASTTPAEVQAGTIEHMKTIIDLPNKDEAAGSDDVETSFIIYKALDRLRILADTAAQTGTSDTRRASLQAAFAKGLSDLRDFVARAPGDLLSIAFGNPTTSIKGGGAASAQDIGSITGKGVMDDHTAPVPGMSGNEVITIDLSSGGKQDSVTVDLSQSATQPPTLDSVAEAFNSAIASIQATDQDGNPLVDGDGNPKPRYGVTFSVTKSTGSYGLSVESDGTQISLQQANAADALVVVDSRTQFDAPGGAHIYRYDNPADGLTGKTLGSIGATDRQAAERAALAGEEAEADSDADAKPATIPASLIAQASVTDADGYTYVVGTTTGDLGTHLSDGGDDLFLTKLDSEGQVVWQQTLGVAGEAQGAAVSLTPDGGVVVAGSVTGPFDGSLGSNSDMLVARFDASGAKQFARSIASTGDDFATAVAVGPDGSIYLGGKTAGSNGGAYVARLDATGKTVEQRVINGAGQNSVTAFAVDGSGNLLALTSENGTTLLRRIDGQDLTNDLGSIDLGSANARAVAVSANGDIAVVGATTAALPGNQVNAPGGGRDGFVTRIGADLATASTTYIGSTRIVEVDSDGDGEMDGTEEVSGDDQLDSVTFIGDDIYVGGRTTGDLAGARRGTVDGFVAQIDAATGTLSHVSQFGGSDAVADPVHVTTARRGSNALGALGLHQGALNGEISTSLSAQMGLNAGDSFSIQVDGGAVHKITIAANESMASLALKIRLAGAPGLTATTPKNDAGQSQLQILVAQGHSVGLIAGPKGADALPKLGLAPTLLHSDATREKNAPVVTPGGSYGLALSTALNLDSAKDAKAALDAIKSAISLTQTAYRSLYWDDAKAARVNGSVGAGSARQQAQLASYQAALQRLSGGTSGLFLL